jgi:hypothetical protein
MKIGQVLTHLGAQLGDVATTFADNGSSNLREPTGKRIKKSKNSFRFFNHIYLAVNE